MHLYSATHRLLHYFTWNRELFGFYLRMRLIWESFKSASSIPQRKERRACRFFSFRLFRSASEEFDSLSLWLSSGGNGASAGRRPRDRDKWRFFRWIRIEGLVPVRNRRCINPPVEEVNTFESKREFMQRRKGNLDAGETISGLTNWAIGQLVVSWSQLLNPCNLINYYWGPIIIIL